MDIALATASDIPALVELLAAQLEEHAIPLAPAGLRAAVEGAIGRPERGVFLLARAGPDAVQGFAYLAWIWTLEHGGKTAWLEELYVRPAHRGHGLGGALIGAALDAARTAGCSAVDLEVEASHARVESLYARAGFRRHARARWVRKLG